MFSERLSRFITSVGETTSSFEVKIGVSKGAIYKPVRNGKTVGLEILAKIFSVYPDLNLEWLITGSGTMFRRRSAAQSDDPLIAEESQVGYSVLKGSRAIVRVVALRQAAGWRGNFEEREELVEFSFYLPARMLPGERDYTGFTIIDNSMEPTLPLKSILMTEQVASANYQKIQTGSIYVVITAQGVVIRRITNRLEERGMLQAFADNGDYAAVDIPLSEVSSVWKARAIFSSALSGERRQLYQLYRDLEERIRLLESRGAGPA